MPLLLSILARVFSPLGGIVSAAAVVAALVASFAYHQQSIGARKATAKTEKANARAISRAAAAARRSLDPATPGVLNPNYRQD